MNKEVSAKVRNIISDQATGTVAVILEDANETWLPIAIGLSEGYIINLYINKMQAQRPHVYDLLGTIMGDNNMRPQKVVIEDLRNNIFYANLYVKQKVKKQIKLGPFQFREVESFEDKIIDARPSDCIAIALKYNVPILIKEDILRAAGFSKDQRILNTQEQDAIAKSLANQVPGIAANVVEDAEARVVEDIDSTGPEELLRELEDKLERAVKREKFEDASILRDQIALLKEKIERDAEKNGDKSLEDNESEE